MRRYVCLVLTVICTLPVHAQDRIAPERPGIGNGSFTVSPGHMYMETGVIYSEDGATNLLNVGQLRFRTGLTQSLEAQLLLNSVTFASLTDTGIEDMAIGIKRDIFKDTSIPLQAALLTTMSIPTGSDFATNNQWIPTLSVIGDYTISSIWTFSSNIGYSFGINDVDEQWLITLTPSFVPALRSNTNIYFGYAGMFEGTTNRHFFELGAAFFHRSIIQLDINSGFQLDSNAYFIGVGLSAWFK